MVKKSQSFVNITVSGLKENEVLVEGESVEHEGRLWRRSDKETACFFSVSIAKDQAAFKEVMETVASFLVQLVCLRPFYQEWFLVK